MKKILLTILALNSLSVAFADIATETYKGETTRGKACSLTIISVSKPEIVPAYRDDPASRMYEVKFQTSLVEKKTLNGALYLSCKDDNCKKFSTDLRQTIVAYTSDSADKKVEITISSDPNNDGPSQAEYGTKMPAYIPTQVSTNDKVCILK